nr:hypothetical protein [Bradyrhizobium algeriense]
MIELADRFDRFFQLLIVVQPTAHFSNAFTAHAELANASAAIAHRQHVHLVPFAARTFRAAALVTNRALQQRTTQQFAGDRQLADKLRAGPTNLNDAISGVSA